MTDLPTFQTTRSLPAPQTKSPKPTAETSSASTDDGAHLDGLRIPELDDGAADPDAPFAVDDDGARLDSGPPEQITQEAFWIVFQTAFNMPGQIMPPLRPMGIQPGEETAARAASDATYALLQIYFPSALTPNSETLAHLMVAAPFFLGKALVVREIIRAERARPVNEPSPAQDAPPKADAEPTGANRSWHMPGQGDSP